MLFRRLQLSQNDGLSARPGARVGRALLAWSNGLTPLASRKFTTLEVKEHQPTVADSVRRRGSMAFCSSRLAARNTLDIARVAARIFRRAPSLSRALSQHCHPARMLCVQP